ncbi:hypothetical protein [Thermoleptolyngbya sp. M55_K2018_002]|uniref:hypothetical protein n=1 Tax=Thermoleptolyngbya sp. M55_K2018_002 TaxID=2747808 RepID=UPI002600F156|nr:hypothetical protein [Thermoleptolyngbya sp. M55_K2018_002]
MQQKTGAIALSTARLKSSKPQRAAPITPCCHATPRRQISIRRKSHHRFEMPRCILLGQSAERERHAQILVQHRTADEPDRPCWAN